jgi:hypothetical protein
MSPQGAPRLAQFDYRGEYVYLLTICTFQRAHVSVDTAFARVVIAQLLRLAEEECFSMPRGRAIAADVRRLVHRWKQVSGFTWRRDHKRPSCQRGYHDHVLRDEDHVMRLAKYVVNNPVRSQLVARVEDYPLVASTEYELSEILAAEEWLPSSETGEFF